MVGPFAHPPQHERRAQLADAARRCERQGVLVHMGQAARFAVAGGLLPPRCQLLARSSDCCGLSSRQRKGKVAPERHGGHGAVQPAGPAPLDKAMMDRLGFRFRE